MFQMDSPAQMCILQVMEKQRHCDSLLFQIMELEGGLEEEMLLSQCNREVEESAERTFIRRHFPPCQGNWMAALDSICGEVDKREGKWELRSEREESEQAEGEVSNKGGERAKQRGDREQCKLGKRYEGRTGKE